MCIHMETLNQYVRIGFHEWWKTSTEHLLENHLSDTCVFDAFLAFLAPFSTMRPPSFSYDIDVMNFFVHIMTIMMSPSSCNQKFDVLK